MADEFRKFVKDVDESHHLKFFHGKNALHALLTHAGAADACDLEMGLAIEQGFDEFFSVEIAAFFAGEDK